MVMRRLDELIEATRDEYCRWWHTYEIAIRDGASPEDTEWAEKNLNAAREKLNRLRNIKRPKPTSPEPTPPNGRRSVKVL